MWTAHLARRARAGPKFVSPISAPIPTSSVCKRDTLPMKRFTLFLPAAALVALAGCGAPSTQTPAAQTRGLAASFVAGRAFDNVQSALKSSDDNKLQSAGKTYGRALEHINDNGALLDGVASVTRAALQLEQEAKDAPRGQREALLARALGKYRAAADFLPAHPQPGSLGANALNMIGYPLADRGTTRADWQRAAQLTRLSLAEWDRQIKAAPSGSPQRLNLQANRAVGALDSYAWSLFRLGRVEEATKKQEQVIEFARQNPGVINSGQYSAEIPYHMAEIYRASGREDEAEEQYRTALDLNPDPELAALIDTAMNAARV